MYELKEDIMKLRVIKVNIRSQNLIKKHRYGRI